MARMDVPEPIASAFIGHEVAAFDAKAKDTRIKDCTYALDQTSEEIVRVLMVISSGYMTTWAESRDRVDPPLSNL